MPKSLAKVHKKISKKKGSLTSLHENSRDSQRLRRASARDDKLSKVAAARIKANQPHTYFQGAAKAVKGPIDDDQTQRLIQSYVQRDEEELAQLNDERRPGRPSSNREDLLKQRIATEEREYEAGFWIPDMTDTHNVELLRDWGGEWTSLNTLKYVRLLKDGSKHSSSFPPKGKS
ncbi:MAG: hypothetical protein Q9187_008985 [Circinaria calcarea]